MISGRITLWRGSLNALPAETHAAPVVPELASAIETGYMWHFIQYLLGPRARLMGSSGAHAGSHAK